MTHEFNKGATIIDYLEAMIKYNQLTDRVCVTVSLTTPEWEQLKALIFVNYDDLKNRTTPVGSGCIVYKDLPLYWDGCSGGKIGYWDALESYLREIERIHDRVRNPQAAVEQQPVTGRNQRNHYGQLQGIINEIYVPTANVPPIRTRNRPIPIDMGTVGIDDFQ